MYKVAKFGGTSLATREQVDKVISIMKDDPSRRFMVVSAPGKRNKADIKMTDRLISITEAINDSQIDLIKVEINQHLDDIVKDIPELRRELSCELDRRIERKGEEDYQASIVSFGEYACARIVREIMNKNGMPAIFCEPWDIGFNAINEGGNVRPDPSSYVQMGKMLTEKLFNENIVVIPGFYSRLPNGRLVTFPRGGSDTSGAVVANSVNATLYENWTDEDGLRRADPRIVKEPKIIKEITTAEARELAYLGFKLQEECLSPLIEKRIPMHVRNTNNPNGEGTLVVNERVVPETEAIAGVASKIGYISVHIRKPFMNQMRGFGRKVLKIFEDEGLSYEHSPTGIDTMSIILERSQLESAGKVDSLVNRLYNELSPMETRIGEPLALVAIVGAGISQKQETLGRTLYAVTKRKIPISMLNMGASELSFFLGVHEKDAANAVRSIYQEFF